MRSGNHRGCKPDMIGPSIPADCHPVAAPIIRAINQETANARGPHFPESDFLLACHRMLAGAWYAVCKWVFHAPTKDGTFLNFPNLGVRADVFERRRKENA